MNKSVETNLNAVLVQTATCIKHGYAYLVDVNTNDVSDKLVKLSNDILDDIQPVITSDNAVRFVRAINPVTVGKLTKNDYIAQGMDIDGDMPIDGVGIINPAKAIKLAHDIGLMSYDAGIIDVNNYVRTEDGKMIVPTDRTIADFTQDSINKVIRNLELLRDSKEFKYVQIVRLYEDIDYVDEYVSNKILHKPNRHGDILSLFSREFRPNTVDDVIGWFKRISKSLDVIYRADTITYKINNNTVDIYIAIDHFPF